MVGNIQHSEATCHDAGSKSQFMDSGVEKRPVSRDIGESRVGTYGEGTGGGEGQMERNTQREIEREEKEVRGWVWS